MIEQNAEFISNKGKGPLRARILEVGRKSVVMERWHERRPKELRVQFKLPINYLQSPACGWVERRTDRC